MASLGPVLLRVELAILPCPEDIAVPLDRLTRSREGGLGCHHTPTRGSPLALKDIPLLLQCMEPRDERATVLLPSRLDGKQRRYSKWKDGPVLSAQRRKCYECMERPRLVKS
jgi:hypothetical protein